VDMMAKTAAPDTTETLPQDARQARVAAILAHLATYDDVELPPDVREWLDQLIGCFHTSFTFDPETYFDEDDPCDGE